MNKAQAYGQHILKGRLPLAYGVDYGTFKALKTCGLPEESAFINGEAVSPYLSTWFLQGTDLDALLAAGREKKADCSEVHTALRGKLCSNLVLLGLNAGAMVKMTDAWHFFHHRLHKKTGEVTQTKSEKNLKEYLTELQLPFEGAYMTDILKFQDTNNSLYIEPDAGKVTAGTALQCHNFMILKHELALLRANVPAGTKILLVPLGGKCEAKLQSFMAWLPAAEREWFAVPPAFMPHYSSAGWSNPRSVEKAKVMQGWCREHIG